MRPHVVHLPGTMCRSRCRTGTSPNSLSQTSSLISALRGSRRLSRETVQAPLVSRRRAAAQVLTPAPGNARARTARDVRQPRSRALMARPTPANLLSRANLGAQGGLDFLFVRLNATRGAGHGVIAATPGVIPRMHGAQQRSGGIVKISQRVGNVLHAPKWQRRIEHKPK